MKYKKIISSILAVAMLSMPLSVVNAEDTASATATAQSEITKLGIAPSGLYIDGGNLLIADTNNKRLWTQPLSSPLGTGIKATAGKALKKGANGRMVGGYHDGDLKDATFRSMWAISPFIGGYAVSDTDNNSVRIIDTFTVETAVGNGNAGLKNAVGEKAVFNHPTGLATDKEGNLYVADSGNNLIRKVDKKGTVTTFAGSVEGKADGSNATAKFRQPTGLCYANDMLYVCDSGNNRICTIKNGKVTTIAGDIKDTEGGMKDGKATSALLYAPQGIVVSGSTCYIADTGNSAIRRLSNGNIDTLLTQANSDSPLYPVTPRGMALYGDKLYIGDVFAKNIYTLNVANAAAVKADANATANGDGDYTVKSGDTLWKIAKENGCTIDAIVSLNGIKDRNNIRVGQQLILPN